jgi:tRNA splicing ligase
MPIKPMVSVVGMPQHVIQRGNNRQVIFADDDMKAYDSFYLNDLLKRLKPLQEKD